MSSKQNTITQSTIESQYATTSKVVIKYDWMNEFIEKLSLSLPFKDSLEIFCELKSILNLDKRLYVTSEHQSIHKRYITMHRTKSNIEIIVFAKFTQIEFIQAH